MDDESQRTRFKFLRLHRLLLIHHRRGRGWVVNSLFQALTTDDFGLSNLPEEPPSPNSSYFPNKVYGPLWSGAQIQADAGRGLRQRARRKRKGKEESQGRVLGVVVVVG